MSLDDLINSQAALRLLMVIGRLVPLRAGQALSFWLADRYSGRLTNPQVQIVRANHQVFEHGQLSEEALAQRTRAVFRNALRSQFEFFHYLSRPQAMLQMVAPEDHVVELVRQTQRSEHPTVFACPHTGNFELAGFALRLMGLNVQLLAQPGQRSDYQAKNRLRQQVGFDITPISAEALRQAIQRLQSGGSVLTGLDWPVKETRFRPRFCGQPSLLSTGYVRLAIKAQAPVVVVACRRASDGIYHIRASQPIPMQPAEDPSQAILQNTEAVLAAAENYIRQDPEQWMMFHRVWEL